MLGVLCARPRPWLLTSLSLSYAHGSAAAPFDRLTRSSLHPPRDPCNHSPPPCGGGAASIWHTILPSHWRRRRTAVLGRRERESVKGGEGSWNVAWDARPARWLHHPESAWLLFAAAPAIDSDPIPNPAAEDELKSDAICNYRVTGVVADGRCLFRAVAHMACLRNGEEAPDENRQRELADELRAQVVEELLKRRKEVEWFIEEDFDVYVKRIQEPYVWGGEPELLMSSHVLRTPISVFMKERSSGGLMNIANYGEEYQKDEDNPINVLFHGYGHYDILETLATC
ncbi:UNVERIFIED_CONTAM: OVARIAN TUMOR DOMAIN-containing deubiquitinating enzyme 4 [Sesamum indicum]